ncbi:MAG: ATP-binding cassette domain-containing protein [Steroidobacteraceae bacterium]
MLEFDHVKLRRGARVLIEDATLRISNGEKVGVVGRNGCGKSTLLALVRGELTPDDGDFSRPDKLAIVSILQELPRTADNVLDYVRGGDLALAAVEQRLALAREQQDGLREATLLGEFESLGGYDIGARAAETAVGLGFAAGELARPVATLSGGLQMRANLARALMARADVLLLDEPTNHLDLDALLWLERWLQRYPGTLLLVSHDREFLDAVVGRIVHIEDGRVAVYSGNYSAFERQAAAERVRVAALAERQSREAARIHAFVERFRAKSSKARQAQSRLKWLAKLEAAPPLSSPETFEWRFEAPSKLPQPLVALDNINAGYGEATILRGVSLDIVPGERLGVLGRNGAGKSTLMKAVAGALLPQSGDRVAAPDLVTGWFAQLELDRFADDDTAMQLLARQTADGVATGTPGGWSEQRCRDHLGQFGFRGERVFEPVGQFSGGERARLALAALVAQRPNLLLLDEPTNHLDFEMRHSLAMALQDFAGAVAVVSHDRALLRAVCDRFVVVGDGRVTPFDGDLEDYAAWLEARDRNGSDRSASVRAAAATPPTVDRRTERRLAAAARQRTAPLREELRSLERTIGSLTTERDALAAALAEPALYADATGSTRARELAQRDAACRAHLATAESRWLEVAEALEAADAAALKP